MLPLPHRSFPSAPTACPAGNPARFPLPPPPARVKESERGFRLDKQSAQPFVELFVDNPIVQRLVTQNPPASLRKLHEQLADAGAAVLLLQICHRRVELVGVVENSDHVIIIKVPSKFQ